MTFVFIYIKRHVWLLKQQMWAFVAVMLKNVISATLISEVFKMSNNDTIT